MRCGVVGREHRVVGAGASVQDLVHVLKDGVLLCILLNRLQPKAVNTKDFSQRPQMSQVCRQRFVRESMLLVSTKNSMFKRRSNADRLHTKRKLVPELEKNVITFKKYLELMECQSKKRSKLFPVLYGGILVWHLYIASMSVFAFLGVKP